LLSGALTGLMLFMIQFTLTDNLTGILCGREPSPVFSGCFWKEVMRKEYGMPVD